MKIVCDSCGTKYSISDDKVRGKVFKIRCKKCSHIIVVRGGEAARPRRCRAARPPKAAGTSSSTASRSARSPRPTSARASSAARFTADTYIWKEGFADWLKLSAVPEFADLVGADSGSVNIGDVFASDGAVRADQRQRERSAAAGARARTVRCSVAAAASADDLRGAGRRGAASGGDLFGSAARIRRPSS